MHRALPFITWNGMRYSVPPECLGQAVEARVPVDSTELTVRWAGNVVATHGIASGGGDVWDPTHRLAAQTGALASNQRRHLRVLDPADPEPPASPTARIDLGAGDYDIAAPDLTLYEGGQSLGDGDRRPSYLLSGPVASIH